MNSSSRLGRTLARSLPEIQPRFIAGVALAIATIVIAFWLWLSGNRLEHLKFSLEVLGGLSAIYSAFYAGEAFWSQFKRSCQAEAFNVLRRYDSLDLEHLEILAAKVSGMDRAAVRDFREKSHADFKKIRDMMSVFDDMASMTRVKYLDEDTLLTVKTRYITFVTQLRPFILCLREMPADEGGVRNFAKDIEAMRDAWEKGERYAGKPAPCK
jgi:hypothetical protein